MGRQRTPHGPRTQAGAIDLPASMARRGCAALLAIRAVVVAIVLVACRHTCAQSDSVVRTERAFFAALSNPTVASIRLDEDVVLVSDALWSSAEPVEVSRSVLVTASLLPAAAESRPLPLLPPLELLDAAKQLPISSGPRLLVSAPTKPQRMLDLRGRTSFLRLAPNATLLFQRLVIANGLSSQGASAVPGILAPSPGAVLAVDLVIFHSDAGLPPRPAADTLLQAQVALSPLPILPAIQTLDELCLVLELPEAGAGGSALCNSPSLCTGVVEVQGPLATSTLTLLSRSCYLADAVASEACLVVQGRSAEECVHEALSGGAGLARTGARGGGGASTQFKVRYARQQLRPLPSRCTWGSAFKTRRRGRGAEGGGG